MAPSIVLLGSGGHARVVLDALRASGLQPAGYVDHAAQAGGFGGLDFLGDDAALADRDPEGLALANGIGGAGNPLPRAEVFDRFKAAGFAFVTIAHPSAVIAPDVRLGEGCQIMAGAVIQTGTEIGRNVIVNTRASIDHDCRVGDHCHIAPGTTLCGGVLIGANSHIGAGAVVVQASVVNENSRVKAASLVHG